MQFIIVYTSEEALHVIHTSSLKGPGTLSRLTWGVSWSVNGETRIEHR